MTEKEYLYSEMIDENGDLSNENFINYFCSLEKKFCPMKIGTKHKTCKFVIAQRGI